jgi:hypothetical protein
MERQYATKKRPVNPGKKSRVGGKSIKHSEVPVVVDPRSQAPPPTMQAPPYIPGVALGEGEPEGEPELYVPSQDELEQALLGGGLVGALRQFAPYADISGAWARGTAMGEAEAGTAQREQRGNVPVMRSLADNAKTSARASLRAIVACARYVAANRQAGGLEKAVEETGMLYNLSLVLSRYADDASSEKGEAKEDPEPAAERYFTEQKMKHSGESSFSWAELLIDDAGRQKSNPNIGEWDRRYWTRLHTLADDYIRKRRDENAERERAGPGLSGWQLLIALGAAAAVIAGVWVFA